MRLDVFAEEFVRQFGDNPEEATHPDDRCLAALVANIDGMSSENVGMTLNLSAGLLEPGECHLEFGCWKGLTLCMSGASDAGPIIGVDSFKTFGGPRAECLANLQTYCPQALLFDMDCWEFLDILAKSNLKIGSYFYDAGHTYEAQGRAFAEVHQRGLFADRALIVVDDTGYPITSAARRATEEWVAGNPEYKIIHDLGNGKNANRDGWWSGIQIVEYRR